MTRTLTEINAEIVQYEKAKKDLMLGKRPQTIKKGDRELSFGSINITEVRNLISQELRTLYWERAQLTGQSQTHGPITL